MMHRVLAATSERAPAGGERGTGGGERGGSGAIDLTGVFFRAWRGSCGCSATGRRSEP